MRTQLGHSFLILLLFITCTASLAVTPRRAGKAKAQPVVKDEISLDKMDDADIQAAWERERRTRWTMPGLATSVPSGYGADWGIVYAGIFFASRTLAGNPISDGSVFGGFGLGSAKDLLGLDVSYAVTDLDPFLADSTLSLKLHRYLGAGFAVAVGSESLFIFGEGIDGVANYYGAVSKSIVLKTGDWKWFSALLMTVGMGSGRFQSWQDAQDRKNGIGAFGSLGVRVQDPLGISLGWAGSSLDAGVSVTPFRSFRMTINLGFRNLYTSYGPGLPKIFDLSLVYGDSIFEDTFPFFSGRPAR